MDISLTLLIMVAFFSTVFGLLLPLLFFQLKYRKLKKQAIEKMSKQIPMFGPIVKGTTCDSMNIGRHDWKSVPIAKKETFDPENPQAEDTLVCMKCGVMSGSNNQFSSDGLALLKKNIASMEAQAAFAEELEQFRKDELEKLFGECLEDTSIYPNNSQNYRTLFDYGVKATFTVDMKIAQKIQQRQMDIIKAAMQGH